MTNLIIFDLDGTLLDTMEDLANACNHALQQCGCPMRKIEEYNMLVGRGIYNLFRTALPEDRRTEDMVQKMADIFIPYYNEHKCDCTKPYRGIIEMLDELSEAGVAFALASNKYQEGAEQLVEKFFGKYRWVRILGQREGLPIKPDPAIVHEAMLGMKEIRLEDVVYCGDSDVDMKTGINAGVKTIGVTWGFRTREELQAYNPWMLADTPDQITTAILNRETH